MAQVVLDAGNSICSSVLVGLGQQGPSFRKTLICCVVVQLPLAWALTYRFELGVRGLRLGACLAGLLNLTYGVSLVCSLLKPGGVFTTTTEELPVDQYSVLRVGDVKTTNRPLGHIVL